MKWASAISDNMDLQRALETCVSHIEAALASRESPSLVTVFASSGYGQQLAEVPRILRKAFPEAVLIGCSAAGIIGDGTEIEDQPAVSLTAAHLPDVELTPFRITPTALPTPDDPPEAWQELTGVRTQAKVDFLLLLDPFSMPGKDFLAGLDFAYPGGQKAGGLASGGHRPGTHALFLNEEIYREGAVGIGFQGNLIMDTVMAQGCRPIGEPRQITRCQENLLLELDGEPPLVYLQRLYPELEPRDQALLTHNLFLGISVDVPLDPAGNTSPEFLIRNLIGVDNQRGMLAIGQNIREGQRVQFHVRDAVSSAEDLNAQLAHYLKAHPGQQPVGGLLFQCNGRGRHLYGRSNHDTNLFQAHLGSVPLGGFFCNGEIGPIGGDTNLHGYTSAFALFRSPF